MAPDVLVVGALQLDVVVTAPRLPRLDETLPGTSGLSARRQGRQPGAARNTLASRAKERFGTSGRPGRVLTL